MAYDLVQNMTQAGRTIQSIDLLLNGFLHNAACCCACCVGVFLYRSSNASLVLFLSTLYQHVLLYRYPFPNPILSLLVSRSVGRSLSASNVSCLVLHPTISSLLIISLSELVIDN